jgi:precorrin-3B synthase
VNAPAPRRALPDAPARRGWCPGLARPMPTGDGLLARVHPPLGVLTVPQVRAVAEAARRYGNGHVDLTARANLQIRGVSEATRADLAGHLEDALLGDVRGDGGPQRLTLTSPLAGHDPAERVDVPAIARAVEAAGRTVAGLPAKTLVVVEGRPDATWPDADLNVIARPDGDVAVAIRSAQGWHLAVACPESQAADTVAALLAAFARSGHRRVRDLSRDDLRGLIRTLATDRRVGSPLRSLPDAGGRAFAPPAGVVRLGSARAGIAVDAPFGRCTALMLDDAVAVAEALGAGEIRLSPTRGLVLIAPPGAATTAALASLADRFIVTPDDPRRAVDACTGAPGCASGSTPTLDDAAALSAAFRPFAAAGMSAHVSGCAKGCARPGPADFTLVARDGLYGAVVPGAPGDEPAMHLPIEAVLKRLGRAKSAGLSAAFTPESMQAASGGDGRRA